MAKRKMTRGASTFTKRKRLRGDVAKRLVRLERRVRRNTEVKKVVSALSIQPDTVATVQLLNGIAQGDLANERDGEKINCVGLELRGTYNRNGTSNGGVLNPVLTRCTILTMKVGDGANPTLAEIFENPADPRSEFNHSARHNFIVHYDRTWNTCYKFAFDDTNQQWETMPHCQSVKFKKVLKNHETRYNGIGGSVGSVDTKPMFMIMWSDHPTSADCPTLNARAILKYVG